MNRMASLLVLVSIAARASATSCAAPAPSSWNMIGPSPARPSTSIAASNFSVGAETQGRNFTVFDNWKHLLAGSGAKFARVQAGWMRCEPNNDRKYNWGWLDDIVVGSFERGVEPWLETSYGNTYYPKGGDNSSTSPMPTGDAAVAAWRAWVTALVCRYSKAGDVSQSACAGIPRAPGLASDVGVSIWEIWNEPLHAGIPAAEIGVFENMTATVIKSASPPARIWVGAIAGVNANAAKGILSTMQKLGGVSLVESLTYHPYAYDPDQVYGAVRDLAALVASFGDGTITIRQGENGAPSTKGEYGALSGYNWTQCSQAKWTTRRMLGDHGRGIWSSIFSIVDMCYDSKINTKGLIEADCPSKTIVGPKMAYYTYNSVASIMDASWVRQPNATITFASKGGSFGNYTPEGFVYKHADSGDLLATAWLAGNTPTNADDTPVYPTTITIEGDDLAAQDLCFVDPIALVQLRVASWSVSHGRYTVDDVPLSDYAGILMACPEAGRIE